MDHQFDRNNMPPKTKRLRANPAAEEEQARAAAASEADIAEVLAGFDSDGSESDGEVDADELRGVLVDDDGLQGEQAHTGHIMTDAAMGCVCLHTRKAYNDNVGQCAVWALTTESFKDEVLRVAGGEQLMVKWPLNQYMVVNFIALLEKKQVPWTYTNKKNTWLPAQLAITFRHSGTCT
jgi:hypothetical protein